MMLPKRGLEEEEGEKEGWRRDRWKEMVEREGERRGTGGEREEEE